MLAALIVAETVFAVTQGKIIQSTMYMEHRGYPGGPWQYCLDTQDSSPMLMHASLFVLAFVGDLLVVGAIVKYPLHICHTLTHLTLMALLGHLVSIHYPCSSSRDQHTRISRGFVR